MTASFNLFLDLGDIFSKALAEGDVRRAAVRYPSVIAHTLLSGGREMEALVLDDELVLPRLSDFDSRQYPRTRSFRGSDDFVRFVKNRPTVQQPRFAGGIAAVYGADRLLLGKHPTTENVDALVKKAFLLIVSKDRAEADVVFVIDTGTKADAVLRYVEARTFEYAIEIQNYRQRTSRKMYITASVRCVDAMACARAVLPPEVATERVGRTLIIDIGYLRTKFAIVSETACEHQQQVDGLGVSDCVHRILRDGQEQGLVEDEFAIVRALETCRPESLQIAGRRFDVRRILDSSRASLRDEIVRVGRRIALDHLARSGDNVRALAIIGGGASLIGDALAERLKAELGFRAAWIAAPDDQVLLRGARRIVDEV